VAERTSSDQLIRLFFFFFCFFSPFPFSFLFLFADSFLFQSPDRPSGGFDLIDGRLIGSDPRR